MGAGAGAATANWFEQAFVDAEELNIAFTAVVTNDPGAVQSVLKWATHLQGRVNYVVVLNEMRESDGGFEFWEDEEAVTEFCDLFHPVVMRMGSRVPEFQAEIRNQCVTLQDVIEGNVNTDFLRKTKNLARAKRYQRELFTGFDAAAHYLLP